MIDAENRLLGGVWDDALQCFVVRLTYDFDKHVGELFIIDGGCCDMTACITLFSRLDHHVKKIETWSGEERDTAYSRRYGGEWRAIPFALP